MKEIDIKNSKTYPLRKRKNKVEVSDFANAASSQTTISSFISSLPNILAAADLKRLLLNLKNAKRKGYPIIWAMGAHVIKTGLNPILIELMKNGYVDHIALNGAGAIHDVEIAMIGASSEEVGDGISDGTFGMVRETGVLVNSAFVQASTKKTGGGRALGELIHEKGLKYKEFSIVYNAYKLNIPVSVHVAIGTDITHMHPNVNPSAIGEASFADFIIFCNSLSRLKGNGVYLNIGSAVVLPEVFLKGITVCRNQGHDIGGFTIANFDFIRQYRSSQNVIGRPASTLKCESLQIIGHHEIMLPLLCAALL